jgi:thiamine biosynthesis protein ThiI
MPEHEARLLVDLSRPELELEVDLRPHAAYVFATRLPGPGGLPVGTLGKGVCLLSGGIDSPVAAWMCMKRGCAVVFVSFHSFPYIGEASRRKIEHLVERLARFQPRSRLYSVPFTDVQTAIRDTAPEGYRTVLYRRQMQRIAARIARREKAGCLITGESLGQVASQTMENLTCIGAASDLPVLRPLIGFDKQETIDLARRIGTYDTSIVPEPDCCTVFMPKRPVIRGRIDRCEEAEAALPLDELLTAAVEGAERKDIA